MFETASGIDDTKNNDVSFNLSPARLDIFHCPASEDMLDISIESGMYMTVNIPEIQGIVKFTGAMALLCTNSANTELIGQWLVPVEDYASFDIPQYRITDSIFDRDSADIASVFSGVRWRVSRKSSLLEIPENISSVMDAAPEGVSVIKPEGFDYYKYIDWQEESTEQGYTRYKKRTNS